MSIEQKAREIAEGLTEAQKRQFLHDLLAEGWFYKAPMGSTEIAMPPDCVEFVTTRPGYIKYGLSRLGLQVRALIEEQKV